MGRLPGLPRLPDEGLALGAQVVVDAEPDRGMRVESVDVGRREEPDVGGLAAWPKLAADDPADEADRELLTHLAVVELEDVVRVGVDADDPLRLDIEAGLLADFPRNRLGDALADVHHPSGKRPAAVVAAAQEHDATLVVGHDRGSAGHEGVGLRGVGLAVVVGARHRQASRRVEGMSWPTGRRDSSQIWSNCSRKLANSPYGPSLRTWSAG